MRNQININKKTSTKKETENYMAEYEKEYSHQQTTNTTSSPEPELWKTSQRAIESQTS
jgi:hypothetical protein